MRPSHSKESTAAMLPNVAAFVGCHGTKTDWDSDDETLERSRGGGYLIQSCVPQHWINS